VLHRGTELGEFGSKPRALARPARLYWEDQAPGALFEHPSVMLLVDDQTGRVGFRQRMSYWPQVGGRDPPFRASPRAENSSRYLVFARRDGGAARPSGYIPLATASLAGPPNLGPANCMVTIGDRIDPLFRGDFKAMAAIAGVLNLQKYDAKSVDDLANRIAEAQAARCLDVAIFIAGHGSAKAHASEPTVKLRWSEPSTHTGKGPKKLPEKTEPLTGSKLVEILKRSTGLTFKIVISSCYAGRFTPLLVAVQSVRVVAVGAQSDQLGWGNMQPGVNYVSGPVKGHMPPTEGKLLQNTTVNPFGATTFMGAIVRGLDQWAHDDAARNTTGDDLAKAIVNSGDRLHDNDFSYQLGRTVPYVADYSSRPTAAPAPTPAQPPTPNPANDFRVTVTGGYRHLAPGSSEVCALITTEPPKPGQRYSITISGPAVVGQGGRAGALDAAGTARESFPINDYGEYGLRATVTDADGTTREGTAIVTVRPAQGTCP
jgi:hypothetical protein